MMKREEKELSDGASSEEVYELTKTGQNRGADIRGGSRELKRPAFLTILCILTFIGSGFTLLISFASLLMSGYIEQLFWMNGMVPREYLSGQTVMMASFISLVLSGASLYGAYRMWRLDKFGFFVYTTVQFVSVFLIYNVLGLLVNAAFVLMYYANYKYMVK